MRFNKLFSAVATASLTIACQQKPATPVPPPAPVRDNGPTIRAISFLPAPKMLPEDFSDLTFDSSKCGDVSPSQKSWCGLFNTRSRQALAYPFNPDELRESLVSYKRWEDGIVCILYAPRDPNPKPYEEGMVATIEFEPLPSSKKGYRDFGIAEFQARAVLKIYPVETLVNDPHFYRSREEFYKKHEGLAYRPGGPGDVLSVKIGAFADRGDAEDALFEIGGFEDEVVRSRVNKYLALDNALKEAEEKAIQRAIIIPIASYIR